MLVRNYAESIDCMGMVLTYSIARSDFIQIMNAVNSLWVTVLTLAASMKKYFSMGGPTSSIIAKHYLHSQRHYQTTYIDVQMQQGCDDCEYLGCHVSSDSHHRTTFNHMGLCGVQKSELVSFRSFNCHDLMCLILFIYWPIYYVLMFKNASHV